MYSIMIVTKIPMGMRGVPIGIDGNLFKKNSTTLKKNLQNKLKEKKLDCTVEVNNYKGDLLEMKQDGANLILLSPYIKTLVDVSGLEEKDYYFMSESDYLHCSIDNILYAIEARIG